MPLFAAFLGNVLVGLAGFFASFLTRKVAVAAAAVSAFGTAIAALLLAFNTLVSPLVAGIFSTSYGAVLGLAFPPIAGTCLASIASCWAACALYTWQRRAISLAAAA